MARKKEEIESDKVKVKFSDYQYRAHMPVLLREVIKYTAPKDGEKIVDATFGGGGYSYALLHEADIEVMAFDRDPNVYIDKEFFGTLASKVQLMHYPFSQMKQIGKQKGWRKVDAVILDIGVSSMQVDNADRGFSFFKNGPLDMRMSQSGFTAADIVNEWAEEDIAYILWTYGEEKKSRKIARNIVDMRKKKNITTTFELRDIIHRSFSAKDQAMRRIDVATLSFQALRIAVNEELKELEDGLREALSWLNKGGRLIVVTFHSLEDRIVKQFMNTYATKPQKVNKYAKDLYVEKSDYELLTRKIVTAKEDEIKCNARARSAKLRAMIKNKD